MISEDELEGDFIPSYWSLWYLAALICLLTGGVVAGTLVVAWFGLNIYRDINSDFSLGGSYGTLR